MYIGKCRRTPEEMAELETDPANNQELDPMQELDKILNGARPQIPYSILEEARKQVIKETLAQGAETAEAFAKLKAQEELNKSKEVLGS